LTQYQGSKGHSATSDEELLHLVKVDILSPQGASEWASPTFITPQKDGRVHWVSDLQELNKVLQRKHIHYLSYGIFYNNVKDMNSLLS
jgi:hypothetical protein